ncbi:hypothetical protein D9613_008949 [Agrocybe pediades]|uniref:HMG box domain-containing protein n=1 Tax=Agrocybe pediades TaxID=84607 RepID=A0A8H4QTI1_9AGAR|nr:hypothetical protein D9613_008949 [Agrocybe pediades]
MPADRGSGDRRTSKRTRATHSSHAVNRPSPYPGFPTPGPSNSSVDTNDEVRDFATLEDAESIAPTPVNVASMVPRMTKGRAKPSKTRKGKSEGHIPRPPNSFMIFRSEYGPIYREQHQDRRVTCEEISQAAGAEWRQLSMAERQTWVKKAMKAKEAHKAQYPDYCYRPRRSNPAKKKKKKSESDREPAEEPQAAANIDDPEHLLSYFLSQNKGSNGMQSPITGHLPAPVALVSGPSPPSFPSPGLVPLRKELDPHPFHLQLPGLDMSDTTLRPGNMLKSTRGNVPMYLSQLLNFDSDAFQIPGTGASLYQTQQPSLEELTFGPLRGTENVLQSVPNSSRTINLQDGEREADIPPLRESEILNPFSVVGSCASMSTVASATSRQRSVKPEEYFYISDEDFQLFFSGSAGVPVEHSDFSFNSLKEGTQSVPAEDDGLAGARCQPAPVPILITN